MILLTEQRRAVGIYRTTGLEIDIDTFRVKGNGGTEGCAFGFNITSITDGTKKSGRNLSHDWLED